MYSVNVCTEKFAVGGVSWLAETAMNCGLERLWRHWDIYVKELMYLFSWFKIFLLQKQLYMETFNSFFPSLMSWNQTGDVPLLFSLCRFSMWCLTSHFSPETSGWLEVGVEVWNNFFYLVLPPTHSVVSSWCFCLPPLPSSVFCQTLQLLDERHVRIMDHFR